MRALVQSDAGRAKDAVSTRTSSVVHPYACKLVVNGGGLMAFAMSEEVVDYHQRRLNLEQRPQSTERNRVSLAVQEESILFYSPWITQRYTLYAF